MPARNRVQQTETGYLVLTDFKDLEDGGRWYKAGDEYPREGVEPTKKRIEALSTRNNAMGMPLIAKK